MRIKNSTSFPHPVLSASTGDYGDRSFQITLEVQEAPTAGAIILNGSMTLDDPSLEKLVEAGHATAGVMVTCRDTYLDRFERCPLGRFSLDLSDGQVRGSVYVRGVVIAAQNNLMLESEAVDAEFPNESRVVHIGDLIALTEELSFEAGLEKLTPLESIFRLKLQDEMKEGTFEVYLEDESIDILVPPSLHHFLSLLRAQPMKDTLLSSLYLPVVMSALEAMRDDGYADKRWYSVMSSRCNAEGIDIHHGDTVKSAQQLLDAPLSALQKAFERTDR